MKNQELGFAMNQTLVIKKPRVRTEKYASDYKSFKDTILNLPGIDLVSHPTEVPGRQIYWHAGGIRKASEDIEKGKNYQIVGIDYQFAELFELEFVAGRNLSVEMESDKEALILNETSIGHMGFESAEAALGEKVNYWDDIYAIIGVLKNFHQQSLREEFEPHLYRLKFDGRGSMGSIGTSQTVALVKTEFDKFFPGNLFNYFFLDDYFNQQYEADAISARVYSLFTGLAMIIIVLGIYGLVSFTVIQQTKQIGIRKVLGASVANIIGMLLKEYLLLIILANVIAGPITYYIVNSWLENIAWRTTVGADVFIMAAISTLFIAVISVAYQVTKAAMTNPVDAIGHELLSLIKL